MTNKTPHVAKVGTPGTRKMGKLFFSKPQLLSGQLQPPAEDLEVAKKRWVVALLG